MAIEITVLNDRCRPSQVFRLWDRARRKAEETGAMPIAAIREPSVGGRLVVIHESDLGVLVAKGGKGA